MNKLVVISVDAMIYEDLAYIRRLPALGKLLEGGALVRRVKSIYPTLTYPCHATMRTGCDPSHHGVVNNTRMIPGDLSPQWLWYNDALKCPDIFDSCKAAGLTTAAVGWPSTGCHPGIDYLVDEVAGLKAKNLEAFHGYYTATGTSEELYEAVVAPNIWTRCGETDNVRLFNTLVACEMIRSFQPDLLMLHLGEPDATRHKYGVFAKAVYDALRYIDEMVGKICRAVLDAGLWNCTNFVVTADHGQLDTTRTVFPNVLLRENGYISVSETGALVDWKAWCQYVGMASLVYVKDPADRDAVRILFEEKIANSDSGISRVFTAEEAAKEGYSGEFSMVLESDGHTRFGLNWNGEYEVSNPNGMLMGSHGFHPDFGPRPTFIGFGPNFKQGAVLEHARLADGAPTYAKLLGVELPDAQGKALVELLK